MDKNKSRRVFKRRKDTGKENYYFAETEEEAIVKYKYASPEEREFIYTKIIFPAFKKIVDSIVNVYRFYTLPNIETHKRECIENLTLSLGKFDESRKSKAFTYFTVAVKNFFIGVKKNYERQRVRTDPTDTAVISTEDCYDESGEEVIDLDLLVESFERVGRMLRHSSNYYKVYRVIQDIIEDPGILDRADINIDKNSVFDFIQQKTQLNRPQLLSIIYRIKKRIEPFKKRG